MSASKAFARFFVVVAMLATLGTLNLMAQTAPVSGAVESYDSPTSVVAQPAPQNPQNPPIVDVCPNIPGVQTTVPADRVKDAAGDCVIPPSAFGAWFSKYWWVLLIIVIAIVAAVVLANRTTRTTRPSPTPRPAAPTTHTHTPAPAPPATPGAPPAPAAATTTTTTTAPLPSPLPAHLRPPATPAAPAAPVAPVPPVVPGTPGTTTTTTATPAVPPTGGTTTPIIVLLVLASSLFAGRAMAAQCDNAHVTVFYPAQGALGQSSHSVVEGNLQNVSEVVIGSKAGSGVSSTFIPSSNTAGIVNWTVAPGATQTAKAITLVCRDGSIGRADKFFRVAATLDDVNRADAAWGNIPPQLQRMMNQPASSGPAPRVVQSGNNAGHDQYAVEALQSLDGFARTFLGDAEGHALYQQMISRQISAQEFGRRLAAGIKNDTASQVNTAVSGLRTDLGTVRTALNGMDAKITALPAQQSSGASSQDVAAINSRITEMNKSLTQQVNNVSGQVQQMGQRVDQVQNAQTATATYVITKGKGKLPDAQHPGAYVRIDKCEVARANNLTLPKGCK